MKKILYFIVLSLLLCGSCNYEQDEEHLIIEEVDYAIDTITKPLYQVSDTINIDTCASDTFIITQTCINAQGIRDYVFFNDTIVLMNDSLWTTSNNNGIMYYVCQYSIEELKKYTIL